MLCKLTDQDHKSYGGLLWGEGVTHTAEPGELPLCTSGWIHYYADPLLAVLHNPIHANYLKPLGWEVLVGEVVKHEGQLKSGAKTLTTVRMIELPKLSPVNTTAYGILVAKEVWRDKTWQRWADDWLAGTDRSAAGALAARPATAARVAAWAAAWAAAAHAAGDAVAAAAWAAAAVVKAAVVKARKSNYTLDLLSLARQAMEVR